MSGHCFPPTMPYRTIAKHFEVLDLLPGRNIGLERIGHAGAVKRHLRCAAILCGRLNSQELVKRWRYVDDVVKLRADCTARRNSLRPVNDQRRPNTAAVGVLLVPFEWSVGGLGPAGRVMIECEVPSNVIQARETNLVGLLLVHHVLPQIERARRPSFGTCTIIR